MPGDKALRRFGSRFFVVRRKLSVKSSDSVIVNPYLMMPPLVGTAAGSPVTIGAVIDDTVGGGGGNGVSSGPVIGGETGGPGGTVGTTAGAEGLTVGPSGLLSLLLSWASARS